jgi:hypothetical protein
LVSVTTVPTPSTVLAVTVNAVVVATAAGVEAAGAGVVGADAAGSTAAALSEPALFEEPHAPSSSVEARPATRLRTMRRGFKEVPFVGSRTYCLLALPIRPPTPPLSAADLT